MICCVVISDISRFYASAGRHHTRGSQRANTISCVPRGELPRRVAALVGHAHPILGNTENALQRATLTGASGGRLCLPRLTVACLRCPLPRPMESGVLHVFDCLPHRLWLESPQSYLAP